MKTSIMAHMVAGYPTMDASYDVAHALINSGISYLEVQFPFSEPSADGPIIQQACIKSLEEGFTTQKGFQFIHDIARNHDVPIFLMSYANLLYTPGMDTFIKKAKEASVHGLIVPDLPFDSDAGFFATCTQQDMEAVPVVVPNTSQERLKAYQGHRYLYTALRVGITGKKTEITPQTREFLRRVKAPGTHVFGGFGIRSTSQTAQLHGLVDSFVIGSALIPLITEHGAQDKYLSLKSFISGFSATD